MPDDTTLHTRRDRRHSWCVGATNCWGVSGGGGSRGKVPPPLYKDKQRYSIFLHLRPPALSKIMNPTVGSSYSARKLQCFSRLLKGNFVLHNYIIFGEKQLKLIKIRETFKGYTNGMYQVFNRMVLAIHNHPTMYHTCCQKGVPVEINFLKKLKNETVKFDICHGCYNNKGPQHIGDIQHIAYIW